MAVYAIGDLQGCYEPLNRLLEQVKFDPARDRLWFAGDIVNRGPASLQCMRFVKSLGDSAVTVQGNHDLHLLAVAFNGQKPKRKDTIAEILDAPDAQELLEWLRQQPILHHDPSRDTVMVHAGIPHIWTIEEACRFADEFNQALRGPNFESFLRQMYGDHPDQWRPDLTGVERLRVITNYLTRMRFISKQGQLELSTKTEPDTAPKGFEPWFRFKRREQTRIVFGHWAALMGNTESAHFIGLDTGCVWGGKLTAIELDSCKISACSCGS